MTAQQQLASILQYIEETGFVPATTRNFILDHGHAIAELLTSFAEEDQARAAIHAYEFDELVRLAGYDEWHALSLSETLAAVLRKRAAALRKLTQDATT